MRTAKTRFLGALMVLGALACGDKGGFPDAAPIDAPPPGGTVTAVWRFVDGETPITDNPCERIGALAVRFTATPIDNVMGYQWSLDCSDLSGQSPEMNPATYNIRIEVVGSGLQVIGDPLNETGVVVSSGNDTGIGEVTFDLAHQGSVTFTINTREADGNCGAAPDAGMGAGITSLNLVLTDTLNVCRDANFEIPIAAGGFDTFVGDCMEMTRVVRTDDDCIDSTVTITIRDTVSGPARLLIRGYQDALECYFSQTDFSILGGNEVTDLGERFLPRGAKMGGTESCSYPL